MVATDVQAALCLTYHDSGKSLSDVNMIFDSQIWRLELQVEAPGSGRLKSDELETPLRSLFSVQWLPFPASTAEIDSTGFHFQEPPH
jgi:hypothetical protein